MNDIIIRNLFRDVDKAPMCQTQKILTFYKKVIELERMKEPDIKDYYEYPIGDHKNGNVVSVDVRSNQVFYRLFERNNNPRETRFPLDLYVGLIIQTENKPYRLLSLVIDYREFKADGLSALNVEEVCDESERDGIKSVCLGNGILPVRFSDFEVSLKEASRLELSPETADAINGGIKANPTLQGILSVLRKEVSDDVTVCDKVFLALSSKSIELSQIYSELNSKYLQFATNSVAVSKKVKSTCSLLESLLLNYPNKNMVQKVDVDSLLSVTKLDESQKQAIAVALGSKISVITGAPGTGKTQVIENLLVNALVRGMKVLVASKNNKAVDNVKDRFDDLDGTGYLLRFGSKNFMKANTLPSIERIMMEMNADKDDSISYSTLYGQYERSIDIIEKGKKALESVKTFKTKLDEIRNQKSEAQTKLQRIEQEHAHAVGNIENNSEYLSLKDCSLEELDRCFVNLKTLENNLSVKFEGIWGWWHRMFSVKKSAALLLNEIELFPLSLKSYYSDSRLGFCSEISSFESDQMLFVQIRKWCDIITNGILLKKMLREEELRYKQELILAVHNLQVIEEKEQQQSDKLRKLVDSIPSVRLEIQESKKWIEDNGLKILKACIKENKKKETAVNSVTAYKAYLPDQIPWRDDEYERFIRRANDFIDVFKLCSVTSLSTKNAFPLSSELFDMVIVDEASQCDIASALPLIKRTKQLVVIGDPMQLRHISSVKVDEEQEIKKRLGLANLQYLKYAECSLYDYCKDYIGNAESGQVLPYMLKCHYRCHPSIIGYSNDMFYGGIMGCRLEVKTNIRRLKGNPQGIVLVNVDGRQVRNNVNVNEAEALKSIELAVQTAESYSDVTIGIVTPFKHQAERINSMIPPEYAERIDVNTVHKYQGDEKDVMIYSLVVTDNSPSKKIYWIDHVVPNLVNVAVTRARSTLYVVCNIGYVKSHSTINDPLGKLVRYNDANC